MQPAILKHLYGLTQDEYDAQAEFQGDVCAICGETNKPRSDGTVLPLFVDHDHITNSVRELLCDRCNKVLGFVHDSPELLAKMIAYLQKHGAGLIGRSHSEQGTL